MRSKVEKLLKAKGQSFEREVRGAPSIACRRPFLPPSLCNTPSAASAVALVGTASYKRESACVLRTHQEPSGSCMLPNQPLALTLGRFNCHQVIYRASQAAGPMAGWVKANLAYAAVLDTVGTVC